MEALKMHTGVEPGRSRKIERHLFRDDESLPASHPIQQKSKCCTVSFSNAILPFQPVKPDKGTKNTSGVFSLVDKSPISVDNKPTPDRKPAKNPFKVNEKALLFLRTQREKE